MTAAHHHVGATVSLLLTASAMTTLCADSRQSPMRVHGEGPDPELPLAPHPNQYSSRRRFRRRRFRFRQRSLCTVSTTCFNCMAFAANLATLRLHSSMRVGLLASIDGHSLSTARCCGDACWHDETRYPSRRCFLHPSQAPNATVFIVVPETKGYHSSISEPRGRQKTETTSL